MYTMSEILTKTNPFPHKMLSSEKTCTINGTEILFRSGDQPDTLRGLSLDGFGIDEAREFPTREIYDILIGRLSNSANAQGFIASSPKGKNWAWQLESEPDTETIIQRTADNPFLPPEYVKSLKTSYTTNFQRQELDADIVEFGAGIINPEWFKFVDNAQPVDAVRFWDIAVSIKTAADYSAGALVSKQNDKIFIHDMAYCKSEYPDLRKLIIETAKKDGDDTAICFEEAGQQRGFIDDIKHLPELSRYTIYARRPHGDKLNRAMPWASRAQLGGVFLVRGFWNKNFLDECASFTADDTHMHDDQIDAVSGAYSYLGEQGQIFSGAF